MLLSGVVSGSTTTRGLATTPPEAEFRLMRLVYNGNYMDYRGGAWTTDAPEAEYHLSQGIRRLTRIDTIDPEKTGDPVFPMDPLDPEMFNHPFLYAVEVGRWNLDDRDAARIRDYLLRGGFLMVDDFHGDEQWAGFMESFRRIFPDRPVVEIPPDSEVFHVAFDLSQKVRDKVQIPGIAALRWGGGNTCEECNAGGAVPHWRGVFDDDGRLMVIINFNMDLGDSWELADQPYYPQPLTALGYRFGISYALYAMTH
jgi:hypothetical protein